MVSRQLGHLALREKVKRLSATCRQRPSLLFLATLAGTAGISLVQQARAASQTWAAGGGTAWYTNANWAGGAYPGLQGAAASNTDIATWTSAATATTFGINITTASLNLGAVSIDSTRTIATSIGNNTATTGGVLRLYGTTVNAVANVIVRNNSSGLLTLQGTQTGPLGVVLANTTNNIINTDGSGGVTISAIISELAAGNKLTKAGSGTGVLTLSNANTYTGTTTISTGALNIQNATALGTTAAGTTVTSGAALQIQGGITVGTEALNIGGTGISSTGALRNISGTNSYGGLLTLSAATRINSDAGTLTLSNTGTITGSGFGLTVGGAGNTAINSIIGTGAGALTKDGAGVSTLSAANTYTGGTTVSAGTLSIAALGNLGGDVTGNNVAVSAGTNLVLGAAANLGSNQTLTINSIASALGGIGVSAGLTLPAFTNNTSTFGGVYGINYTGTNGITSLATLDANFSAYSGGGSGHWFLGSQTTGNFDGTTLAAASDSTYRLGGGGGTLTMSGTNALTGANAVQIGSNVTNGGGTVVLGAAQNYTGATTVSAGTLKLGHAGALGDGTNNTSSVTVSNSAILDLGGISPTFCPSLTLNSSANGFDVGAFENNTSSTTSTYSGSITLQQQTRFGGGGAMLLTGAITGNGVKIIKDSTGLLELQNSGTVTLGQLQGNRGTLQVDAGTTLNVTSIEVGTGNSVGASLALNGGSVISTGTSRFGQGSGSASGTLNLNSGTLTVPALTKGSLAFNLNFAGGTLKASANSASFIPVLTLANVKDGGATIDSGIYSISCLQPLVHFTGATTDSLTKLGTGTLTLSATGNTYAGVTTVSQGVLNLTGSVTGAGGAVTVTSAATLTGSGSLARDVIDNGLLAGTLNISGTLSGSGLVSPGNSPGIETVGSINPSGGLQFAFEFSSGNPTYSSPTASANDVLNISGATPFATTLTGGNVVSVYFANPSFTSAGSLVGQTITGGFATLNSTADFTSSIQAATFNYYFQDDSATTGYVTFNSHKWMPLTPSSVVVSTVLADADNDLVTDDRVAQFAVVTIPEPASVGVVASAMLFGLTPRRRSDPVRRRKHAGVIG